MLRAVILAGAALAIASAGAVSFILASTEARGQTTVSVEVGSDYFCSSSAAIPCETDIMAGDTVSWQWVSGTHTVTECDDSFVTCPPAGGGFDSGFRSSPATFSQTFNTAGSFEYRCNVHPTTMQGRVNVAAQATPTATATGGGTSTPSPPGIGSPTAAPGTRTAAPAAVPGTGGTDGGDGTLLWALVVLAGGVLLTASAVVGMAKLRSR